MRSLLRRGYDKLFTGSAYFSIALMAAALLVILIPILYRGAGAVVFRGTVEFRKLQLKMFNRGDRAELDAQVAQAREARQPVFELLEGFVSAIDTDELISRAKQAGRQYRTRTGRSARRVRRALQSAYETVEACGSGSHPGAAFKLAAVLRAASPELPVLPEPLEQVLARTDSRQRRELLQLNRYTLKWETHDRRFPELMQTHWSAVPTESRQGILDKLGDGDEDALRAELESGAFNERSRPLREQIVDEVLTAALAGQLRGGLPEDATEPILSETLKAVIRTQVERVEALAADRYRQDPPETLLAMARSYRKTAEAYDLSRVDRYREEYKKIRKAVKKLLGPLPGERGAQITQFEYGATRWDKALRLRRQITTGTRYVEAAGQKQLVKQDYQRMEVFAGTPLADRFEQLVGTLDRDLDKMLLPQWTFYWQYFTDSSTPGGEFGGVGPQLLGTALLTLVAMAFAVPLGVVAAAYLIECAGDNVFVRVIRMCINTLAGVPSIVFGLFGLAFIVSWLQPNVFGLPARPSILAGGLTLGVLSLPVVIRASEEAIRSVPLSYKEAGLSLGAGSFRTFMTVTLPAALPGILTGIILALGRAAGETAPIIFTAAVASPHWAGGLADQTPTLPTQAFWFATADDRAAENPHAQYGTIATLIVLVLILNVTAIVVRSRVSRKLRGG